MVANDEKLPKYEKRRFVEYRKYNLKMQRSLKYSDVKNVVISSYN